MKIFWCPDYDSTLVLRIVKRHLHQSDRSDTLLPHLYRFVKSASRGLPSTVLEQTFTSSRCMSAWDRSRSRARGVYSHVLRRQEKKTNGKTENEL